MTTLPPLPPSEAFSLTRSIYTAEDMRAYGAACAAAERERIAAWIATQRNDIPATGLDFAAAIRALTESKT